MYFDYLIIPKLIYTYLGLETLWAYLDLSGPIWSYLGLSAPASVYLMLSGPIWSYLGLCGPI